MTDAYTTLRDDLEAARTAIEMALNSAIAAEQAAWKRYEGSNNDRLRAAWKTVDAQRNRMKKFFDAIDAECKAAANVTAGAPGTEPTP